MEPGRDEVITAVEEVWFALVKQPIERVEELPERRPVRHLTACCQITGGWRGALTIDVPFMLGIVTASAMLDCAPTDLLEEEVHDAVGELANVIAGRFKGNFDQECKLGLPAVFEGTGLTVKVPGADISETVAWRCGKQYVHANLHAPKPARLALSGRVVDRDAHARS